MNPLITFWICFLLVRLCFLSEGRMLSPWRFRLMMLAHVALIVALFEVNELFVLVSLIGVVLLDFVLYWIEQRLKRSSSMLRSLSMLGGLGLGLVLLNSPLDSLMVSEGPLSVPYYLPTQALCFVLSLLFCLKESNFIIRWFFQHYQLIEKVEAEKDAPATANGRIIGNLERLLLMCFLWEGAVVAATFIVAVKGLARFKKMEEHQAFAEYVIIGTFLSVLMALVIYQFCKFLLML